MKTYADLADDDEDVRIGKIGHVVMHHRQTAAVCVDDIPGKAERYIRKLKKRFPGIVCNPPAKGPVKGVVTFQCLPPQLAPTQPDQVS